MKKKYEKPRIVEEIELSTIYAQNSSDPSLEGVPGWEAYCQGCGGGDDPNPGS